MRLRGLNINRIISALTMMVMLWDTFGWFGSNLLLKIYHSAGDTHYCTVSFCMCKLDKPFSVCDCHYAAGAKEENGEEDNKHHIHNDKEAHFKFSSDAHEKEYCSTKKNRSHKNMSEVIIVWTEYRAFLPNSDGVYNLIDKTHKYLVYKSEIREGFPPEMNRPPIV